jgi:hypothetical protein
MRNSRLQMYVKCIQTEAGSPQILLAPSRSSRDTNSLNQNVAIGIFSNDSHAALFRHVMMIVYPDHFYIWSVLIGLLVEDGRGKCQGEKTFPYGDYTGDASCQDTHKTSLISPITAKATTVAFCESCRDEYVAVCLPECQILTIDRGSEGPGLA